MPNNNCVICGETARQSLGGVLLRQSHAAAGETVAVDVAKIAHAMKQPENNTKFAPSASDVRFFLKTHDLTGCQAAKMMYLSGSNQVRKYTGGESPRQMDGARWFCLHAHALLPAETIAMIEAAMAANIKNG